MVENLKETVKNILEDEKKVKEFGELKTLEEVYEKCKELGYTSDYEEFKKDYDQIVYGLNKEIFSEELESVTGGKMNSKFTKIMATTLSALTLSTTVVPSSNVSAYSSPISKVSTFVKENPGKSLLIAMSALGIGVATYAFLKNQENEKNNNFQNNNSQNQNNNEDFYNSIDDYSHYKYFSKLLINKNEKGKKFVDALNRNKKNIFKMSDDMEFIKENNINNDNAFLRIKGISPSSPLDINFNIKSGEGTNWTEYKYELKEGRDLFHCTTYANFENQIFITFKKNDYTKKYQIDNVASLRGFVEHVLRKSNYNEKGILINGSYIWDKSMYDIARSIFSDKSIPINKYL